MSIFSLFIAAFLLLFFGSTSALENKREIALGQGLKGGQYDTIDPLIGELTQGRGNRRVSGHRDQTRAIRNLHLNDLLCGFIYKLQDIIESFLINGVLKSVMMTYNCVVLERCTGRSDKVRRLDFIVNAFHKAFNKWTRTVCPIYYY